MFDSEVIGTEKLPAILGVSRRYIVKIIENGDLPARKVGRYRRLSREDVHAYRDKVLREARFGRVASFHAAQAEVEAQTRHRKGSR